MDRPPQPRTPAAEFGREAIERFVAAQVRAAYDGRPLKVRQWEGRPWRCGSVVRLVLAAVSRSRIRDDQLVGAFARDRAARKQWWDDRLWLQMLFIAAFCVGAGFLVGMGLVGTLVLTAVFIPIVYLLARFMIGREP